MAPVLLVVALTAWGGLMWAAVLSDPNIARADIHSDPVTHGHPLPERTTGPAPTFTPAPVAHIGH